MSHILFSYGSRVRVYPHNPLFLFMGLLSSQRKRERGEWAEGERGMEKERESESKPSQRKALVVIVVAAN